MLWFRLSLILLLALAASGFPLPGSLDRRTRQQQRPQRIAHSSSSSSSSHEPQQDPGTAPPSAAEQQQQQHQSNKSSSRQHYHPKLDGTTSRNDRGGGRRSLLVAAAATAVSTSAWLGSHPDPAQAVITDETDNFADNFWSSDPQPKRGNTETTAALAVPSDEVTIRISKTDLKEKGGLGLELADIEFKTNIRVFVKSVKSGSYADKLGIEKNWIFVAINGKSMERTNASGVAQYVSQAVGRAGGGDFFEVTFRDPSVFRQKLQNLSSPDGGGGGAVTTQVAPAGDTTQRSADGSVAPGRSVTAAPEDQRITVEQLVPPQLCARGAATDDLLEISYTGRVRETGQIFDGSSILIDGRGIPGRGSDISIFFVLGKQPFGQFPPGWDVGVQGMCVGERRRLLVPPALAYGSAGLPRRNIPPNAVLQYDVTLVSLNGLSTPQ